MKFIYLSESNEVLIIFFLYPYPSVCESGSYFFFHKSIECIENMPLILTNILKFNTLGVSNIYLKAYIN